jgi:predicted MFS family arabinose efflux permease
MAWLIGAGLGPVVINFVINWSYPLAFWMLIGVLGGALLLILIVQVPKISPKKQTSGREFFKELWKEFVLIKLLYPGMFVQTMSIGILIPIIALYARSEFGFNSVQLNYLLIGCGTFTITLLLPAGKIVDRLGIKGPLVGGFLFASISLILLPFQRNIYIALIVGVLLGISYSFILPSWNGLMARAVSPEKRGTMWAIFMTIEGLGTSLGVYVGGRMWESFGHRSPFFASAFVLGTMSMFYLFSNLNKLMAETRSSS